MFLATSRLWAWGATRIKPGREVCPMGAKIASLDHINTVIPGLDRGSRAPRVLAARRGCPAQGRARQCFCYETLILAPHGGVTARVADKPPRLYRTRVRGCDTTLFGSSPDRVRVLPLRCRVVRRVEERGIMDADEPLLPPYFIERHDEGAESAWPVAETKLVRPLIDFGF